MNTHCLYLLLLFCLKGENEKWVNWENWVGGGRNVDQFFKKSSRRKGKGEKYEICRGDEMFLF